MAKKKSNHVIHPVHSYFDFNARTQRSICKVGGCVMKGRHTFNLFRHIQRKHSDTAKALRRSVQKYNGSRRDSNDEIVVRVSKSEIVKACVELTTVNGRPLTIVQDSGFKKILKPVLEALEESGDSLNISQENVKEQTRIELSRIEEIISHEMKDKLISLKIDSVETMQRYVIHFFQ